MSTTLVYNYQKLGAVFADGAEAHADKNSLFSPELAESVENCYTAMLANGILLEPVSYNWDQATYTLSVFKVVSSREAYLEAATFDSEAVVKAAADAGWVKI